MKVAPHGVLQDLKWICQTPNVLGYSKRKVQVDHLEFDICENDPKWKLVSSSVGLGVETPSDGDRMICTGLLELMPGS
jgi:hypothetical protein